MDEQIRAFCAQQKEWLQAELVAGTSAATQAASTNRPHSHPKSNNHQKTNKDEEPRALRVLSGLTLLQVTVGLYGRTVLELGGPPTASSSSSSPRLPAHKLTPGDEVEIRSASVGDGKTASTKTIGVISSVSDTAIAVAVGKEDHGPRRDKQNPKKSQTKKKASQRKQTDNNDDDDDEQPYGPGPYTLVPSTSVQVHQKMVAALDTLAHEGTQHPVAGAIVQALFATPEQAKYPSTAAGPTTGAPIDVNADTPDDGGTTSRDDNPYLRHLDDSQVEAVQFCLAHQDDGSSRVVSLIHGPPGTGKTTTLTALVRQAVQQHHWRVLVTAPSNVAVDNVLAKLMGEAETVASSHKRLRVVRLGHPARLQPAILPYSLEALVQSADGTEIVADVRRDLQHYLQVAARQPALRATARREIRQLRAEVRQREQAVVRDILTSAQVVLATTVGAAAKILDQAQLPPFDLVVIDEAAQAMEASCWIPILRGRRLILAGDHCQLPPTIQSSQPAVLQGLRRTLFERTLELYGDHELSSRSSEKSNWKSVIAATGEGKVSRMLKVQYRMNQRIADWASHALYGGQLQTHETVAQRTLAGMVQLRDNGEDDDLGTPLLLIDTAGCALYEQVNAAGSRYNEGEGQIVRQHVVKLVERGVLPPQIAVITPYNGQVELLRNLLLQDYPTLEIRSVDGFQGGERPVVVLSLVRSSARGGMDGIGFLKDDRRLNVAVTRAQCHCCVVADSETVSQSSFVKTLLEWIEEHGDTRSALEFLGQNHEVDMSSDLAAAELEINRIMAAKESKPAVSSKTRGLSATTEKDAMETSEKHEELSRMINDFSQANVPGSVLPLSSELSSRNRRFVHELAERLGIFHQSTGTEGVDRRITLSIPIEESHAENSSPTTDDYEMSDKIALEKEREEEGGAGTETGTDSDKTKPSFGLLVESESEEDIAEDAIATTLSASDGQSLEGTRNTSINNVLRNLAEERARRERDKQVAAATKMSQSNPTRSLPRPIPSKKKGKRLGNASQTKPPTTSAIDDDLDDMAFLDAQIEQVQNSHGRHVEGKGNYRSIVNGILLAKPEPRDPPKNTKASDALQSKLKKAQDGRKAKPKKKR